uniref:Uncharacterized protein n=1 Tax=Anguilla anguilla TaxID=7936 RepID=A0A0E9WNW3_ANGAN
MNNAIIPAQTWLIQPYNSAYSRIFLRFYFSLAMQYTTPALLSFVWSNKGTNGACCTRHDKLQISLEAHSEQ